MKSENQKKEGVRDSTFSKSEVKMSKRTFNNRLKKSHHAGRIEGFDHGYAFALFKVLNETDNGKLIGQLFSTWIESTDDQFILFSLVSSWGDREDGERLFEKLIWSLKEADAEQDMVEWVEGCFEIYKTLE